MTGVKLVTASDVSPALALCRRVTFCVLVPEVKVRLRMSSAPGVPLPLFLFRGSGRDETCKALVAAVPVFWLRVKVWPCARSASFEV